MLKSGLFSSYSGPQCHRVVPPCKRPSGMNVLGRTPVLKVKCRLVIYLLTNNFTNTQNDGRRRGDVIVEI